MRRGREPWKVVLSSPLDERHVSSSIMHEAMHIHTILMFDEASALPDGSPDRAYFTDVAEGIVAHWPEFALSLHQAPLGLSTPFWMPARAFRAADHVYVERTVVDLDDPTSYAALSHPRPEPLDLSRSAWDLTVFPLHGGGCAATLRTQHVLGDGLWIIKVLEAVFGERDFPSSADAGRPVGRRPVNSAHGLLILGSRWVAARVPGRRTALGQSRKLLSKARVKRVAQRWGRPVQNWVIELRGLRDKHLPPRNVAAFRLPDRVLSSAESHFGCSTTTLMVAATLWARRSAREPGVALELLVPVSHRGATELGTRNHTSILKVATTTEVTLDEVVESVAHQIADHIASGGARERIPSGLGYATSLVAGVRGDTGSWGRANITSGMCWPPGDPGADVNCLALSVSGVTTVALSTIAEIDAVAMARQIETALTATADVRAAR